VIGEVKNDRVFGEAGFFQFFQPRAGVGIRSRHGVVVLRPIQPHFGRIRMVRRHADFGGIVELVMRANPQLAFVAFGGVENREERLASVSVFPMGGARGFVPDLARFFEVVILLRVVRAIVTGLAQVLWEHLLALRKSQHTSHVLTARRGCIEAGDERRASGRTDGSAGPSAQIGQAPRGELVHVRRGGVGITVTAHVGAMILAGDPKDVRAFGRKGSQRGGGEVAGEKNSFHDSVLYRE